MPWQEDSTHGRKVEKVLFSGGKIKMLLQKFLRWRAGVMISRKNPDYHKNVPKETPELKSCLEKIYQIFF